MQGEGFRIITKDSWKSILKKNTIFQGLILLETYSTHSPDELRECLADFLSIGKEVFLFNSFENTVIMKLIFLTNYYNFCTNKTEFLAV